MARLFEYPSIAVVRRTLKCINHVTVVIVGIQIVGPKVPTVVVCSLTVETITCRLACFCRLALFHGRLRSALEQKLSRVCSPGPAYLETAAVDQSIQSRRE